MSRIVDGGGDWRGRAQQITLLKAKINDLQQAQVMPAAVTPKTGVSALTLSLHVASDLHSYIKHHLSPLGGCIPFGIWVKLLDAHCLLFRTAVVPKLALSSAALWLLG